MTLSELIVKLQEIEKTNDAAKKPVCIFDMSEHLKHADGAPNKIGMHYGFCVHYVTEADGATSPFVSLSFNFTEDKLSPTKDVKYDIMLLDNANASVNEVDGIKDTYIISSKYVLKNGGIYGEVIEVGVDYWIYKVMSLDKDIDGTLRIFKVGDR